MRRARKSDVVGYCGRRDCGEDQVIFAVGDYHVPRIQANSAREKTEFPELVETFVASCHIFKLTDGLAFCRLL